LPISWEKSENLKTGNPSPENVSRIEKTFTFTRKDERLRKTSVAAAIFLLLLLVASAAASVVAFVQTKNAAAATNLAVEKEQIANQKTKDAEEATEKANFEADRALKNEEIANQKTEEARVKTEEADKATKRAEEEKAKADKASKLAAEKTKLADSAQKEAEEQTKIAEAKKKEAEEQGERSRRLSYATNIQLAARLYDAGQVEPFLNVLNGTDSSLRGFEWNYLNHLPEGLMKFEKSDEDSEITRIMFSPDGKYLVSAGWASSLSLWNPKTGEKTKLEIDESLNKEEFTDFAFSPKGDRLAALYKKNILVWKTADWEGVKFSPETKFDFPGDEEFKLVTFGESIDELLTISSVTSDKGEKYFLRRWNIPARSQAEGSREIKLLVKKPVRFEVLKVNPDGKTYVSYRETDDEDAVEQVSILDLKLKETKIYEAPEVEEYQYDYTFSETGQRIAIIKTRMTMTLKEPVISVWDIPSNKSLISLSPINESKEQESIKVVALSPNEKKLAVLHWSEIRIWDIEKNQLERIIPLPVRSVAFSPDSAMLVAGMQTLTLWGVGSHQDVFTFNDEAFLEVSSDGKRAILTNLESGRTDLWDTVEKKPIKELGIYKDSSMSVNFSTNGKHFIFRVEIEGDSELPLQLRDAATGDEIKLISDTECKFLQGTKQTVFSDNGKRLAASCVDGTVRVWNLEDQNGVTVGREISKLQTEKVLLEFKNTYADYDLRFVRDDKIAIFIHPYRKFAERNTQVWDVESGMQANLEVCSEKIFKFSPNGEWMVTYNDKNKYGLRNIKNKRCDEKPSVLVDRIKQIIFSNDGRFLALSYEDQSLRIGNLTNTTISDVGKQQKIDQYVSIEFSPKGRWLRAGNKYWNTETGENFTVFGCTEMPTFSVDENRLITSCEDGTLKFWSLESGQEVLTIKADYKNIQNVILMEGNKNLLFPVYDGKLKLWRTEF
jgi:WD40 repeat protein